MTARRWTPVLLAAVVGLAAACGGSDASSTASASQAQAQAAVELPPTPLEAAVTSKDLGTVGINDGLVHTTYEVTNTATTPVRIIAAYTSCMCTTATIEFKDGSSEGPFGMPGHDGPTTLDHELAPGETFQVRATFDPLAHGPDAVGPVQRAIAIHSDNGGMLELDFNLNVVKDIATTNPS